MTDAEPAPSTPRRRSLRLEAASRRHPDDRKLRTAPAKPSTRWSRRSPTLSRSRASPESPPSQPRRCRARRTHRALRRVVLAGRADAAEASRTPTTTQTAELPPPETVGGERSGQRRRSPRTPPALALPAQLQDPGGHPPPADPAGAGGQGGARHQGRGADHLSLARRPLRRADAELAARRRHLAQDHLGRRPPPAEGGHGRARYPARHGPDRAHRRRQPPEARDQARLRIPAAAVGRHPRAHPASRSRRR